MKQCKLITLYILCLLLFFSLSSQHAYASSVNIPIYIDNVPAYSDVAPFVTDGVTMVPIRFISEEFGATITWEKPQITIKNKDLNIVLYVGKNKAMINGDIKTLSMPPKVIKNRTFLPLRFISEALSAKVLYKNQKVSIYSSLYDEYLQNQNSFLAQQDEILYFANYKGEKGIYQVDQNLNSSKLIKNITGQYNEHITVSGDYLYYDDKELNLTNMQERRIAVSEPPYRFPLFIRDNAIYFAHNGYIKKQIQGLGKEKILPIDDYVKSLLAVSNSGLVYANYSHVMYYSFSTKEKIRLYSNSYYFGTFDAPEFTKDGTFYYRDSSETKESYHGSSYDAIFSIDIDGTNRKEIFTEEKNYLIKNIKVYDDWIYYVNHVPVIIDHEFSGSFHIDYYSGSLNRVKIDGSQKQKLTSERINDYAFYNQGIYYRHIQEGSNIKEGVLLFSDLDKQ